VVQQAGKSAADSVSPKAETPGRSNAARATMAASLRMTCGNLDKPLPHSILANHARLQYAMHAVAAGRLWDSHSWLSATLKLKSKPNSQEWLFHFQEWLFHFA